MSAQSRNNSTAVVRNKESGKLETICLDTGEILRAEVDLSRFKFDFDTAMLICQSVREGATLKSLGEDMRFPSLTVIHYWRRSNATFDEEIKMARKDRAEYYHDKVVDLANDTVDSSEVAVAKFKADQFKWAAEKGDPSSYGNKIEHSGSNVAPTIVVMTGIDRRPDIEVTDYAIEQDEEKATTGELPSEEIHDIECEQSVSGDDGGGLLADDRGLEPETEDTKEEE